MTKAFVFIKIKLPLLQVSLKQFGRDDAGCASFAFKLASTNSVVVVLALLNELKVEVAPG
jgi:hypothetical protein